MENKRLYRSSETRVIGGVSGGLAEYFDIDPVIIRILFVALALFGGGGILVYVVLWIVLPEQKSYKAGTRSRTYSEASPHTDDIPNPETAFTMNKEPQDSSNEQNDPYRTRGSLIAGVVLITLGSLFLIDNFVPNINFGHLWPVLLVVLGIVILGTSIQGGKGNDKRNKS